MDKEAGKIYVSTDYEKFKRLKGNREVKSGVASVIKSIDKVGYVLSPILVNEKYEVIDGQHRLQALREKGLPVYYMMQEGIGLEECQSLNTGQSNWKMLDYIYAYAESGIKDYQLLANLMTKYKKDIYAEGVLAFTLSEEVQTGGNKVKQGTFKLSEYRADIAEKRIMSAIELGYADLQKEKKMLARSWYGAVAYVYAHEEVSARDLIKRLRLNYIMLVSYTKVTDQLALFDEINNKGKKKRKVFMSADYQIGKYRD